MTTVEYSHDATYGSANQNTAKYGESRTRHACTGGGRQIMKKQTQTCTIGAITYW
ncbi:hypothetical protein BofuT4_P039370.1 [Botrytis cinerea T4]|uniref:Uncharacterized protein n=1 Tax=Botryotinia fuckeliana (strain T4) TaxID=999810 RepID=G2Y2Z5_BOTF4|nr:hypothetical protein BofuT4_P039370.1 [Botrytis cinerea T4]